MSEDVLVNADNGILELQMNRQEARNAISPGLTIALQRAITKHAYRDTTRCMVLSSSSKVFSVGGDVRGFVKSNKAKDEQSEDKPEKEKNAGAAPGYDEYVNILRSLVEVSRVIYELPKPTIAAIPGAAAGGGLSLALACDYRIAARNAKINTAFSPMGVAGDFGCAYFLTRIVGPDKAKDLLFSGKLIPTEEALELGILSELVDEDDLHNVVDSKARELAAGPTVAYGHMKRNVQAALEVPISQYLDMETERMVRTFNTNDHKRAAKAFMAKSRPVFEGN